METNALILQIDQNNLEPEARKNLLEQFQPFFEQAQEWDTKAKALVVTKVEQIAEMKQAREARLILKDIRVNVEKTRKTLKEDSLRTGKAIDGIANVIKFLIEPIEEHLEKQEKFAERAEEGRKQRLKAERTDMLSWFDVTPEFYDLGNMPDATFNTLLENSKLAFHAKKAAADKAEADRIEAERLRQEELEKAEAEKERLAAEALAESKERERVALAERQEAEDKRIALEKETMRWRIRLSELKEATLSSEAILYDSYTIISFNDLKIITDEAFTRLRDIHNSTVDKINADKETERLAEIERQRNEKAENLKLANELKAKEEAEAKAKQEEELRQELELSKGDQQKFDDLQKDLESLKTKYAFKSSKYKKLQATVNELLDKIINYAISKT